MSELTVRERTRRVMQTQLAEIAQDLFLAHGYDSVSVEQIAAAAGMSRRTFFRYFPSKDELMIGKYSLWADEMVEALRARPVGESPWLSLRRTFDMIVDYYGDDHRRERVMAVQEVIDASPALSGAAFSELAAMQRRLAAELMDRSEQSAEPLSKPMADAIASTAWACVQAALPEAYSGDGSRFSALLDTLMRDLPEALDSHMIS